MAKSESLGVANGGQLSAIERSGSYESVSSLAISSKWRNGG
jgi:hypothetical protein